MQSIPADGIELDYLPTFDGIHLLRRSTDAWIDLGAFVVAHDTVLPVSLSQILADPPDRFNPFRLNERIRLTNEFDRRG